MPGPLVLHLDVSRERLLGRLTARRQCAVCGAIFNLLSRPSRAGARCENDGGELLQRDDDSESVILRRLAEFEMSSAPLVAVLPQGGLSPDRRRSGTGFDLGGPAQDCRPTRAAKGRRLGPVHVDQGVGERRA